MSKIDHCGTEVESGKAWDWSSGCYGTSPGVASELVPSVALSNVTCYHAAGADILRRLERKSEAKRAYQESLQPATNKVEQEYLKQRLVSANAK